MALILPDALKAVPTQLLNPLLDQYNQALMAHQASDWEKVGLKAGKLCEIAYTILRGHVDGHFAGGPAKPANMVSACTAFEQADSNRFSRAVRIQIPRVLIAVYELRNNRDIGHIGGDVDPNEMDAEFFLRSIKWVIAELVRLFHGASVDDAQKLVDAVSERSVPSVWSSGGRTRVLRPELRVEQKVLLVLYRAAAAISRSDLLRAVNYKNLSRFKSDVLPEMHDRALIDFDELADSITILPPGIKYVEKNLL